MSVAAPTRIRELPALLRPVVVYVLMLVVGAAAFLWPFFVPAEALPSGQHTADAPLVAAVVGALVVVAVLVEVRNGSMNGATVALLGVLSATAGLLRLIDLPGGGSGIFFLVVLAGAAFGPRFGLLLGISSMAVSAVLTGGIGPWLPFQMLALGWMAGGAGFLGLVTRRAHPRVEVAVLAAYGWVWGFLYGAIMNLWFWPFIVDGGALSYAPGLSLIETARAYWGFYVVSSFGWDADRPCAARVDAPLRGTAVARRRGGAASSPGPRCAPRRRGGLGSVVHAPAGKPVRSRR